MNSTRKLPNHPLSSQCITSPRRRRPYPIHIRTILLVLWCWYPHLPRMRIHSWPFQPSPWPHKTASWSPYSWTPWILKNSSITLSRLLVACTSPITTTVHRRMHNLPTEQNQHSPHCTTNKPHFIGTNSTIQTNFLWPHHQTPHLRWIWCPLGCGRPWT